MGDFLEQLSNVPTGQKLLVLFLLTAGVFCGFYFLLFQPLEDETQGLHATVLQQDQTLSSLPQNNNRIVELRAEISERCEQQTSFQELLPAAPSVELLLETVYGHARRVGLGFDAFNNTQGGYEDEVVATESEHYGSYEVLMNVRGTYAQLADYFFHLSNEPRIMNVSGLSMSPASDSIPGQPPFLDASFSIRTYFALGDNTQPGGEICQSVE